MRLIGEAVANGETAASGETVRALVADLEGDAWDSCHVADGVAKELADLAPVC